MIICEYCGYGNPDDAGACQKCGAPRGRAFGKSPTLAEKVRSLVASVLPAGEWPVRGIDVSAWNGKMDWVRAATKVQFAFLRAGYNDTGKDICLGANYAGSVRNEVVPGLYWFAKAGLDYHQHAQSLWEARKVYGGPLLPALDCEATLLNPWDTTNWIYSCICTYEDLSGETLQIYTSPGWWNANTVATRWASTFSLWNAHWTLAASPLLPNSWSDAGIPASFWQHSADNNGLGREYGSLDGDPDMDLDRFIGTVADFNNRFHTSIKPLSPPEPLPADEGVIIQRIATVTAGALNVRDYPDISGGRIGVLPQNTQVGVTRQSGDWLHIEGWIHKNYVK